MSCVVFYVQSDIIWLPKTAIHDRHVCGAQCSENEVTLEHGFIGLWLIVVGGFFNGCMNTSANYKSNWWGFARHHFHGILVLGWRRRCRQCWGDRKGSGRGRGITWGETETHRGIHLHKRAHCGFVLSNSSGSKAGAKQSTMIFVLE